MRLNPLALSKLGTAPDTAKNNESGVFAYIEIENGARFDFLVNPSSIDIKAGANVESVPSHGTNVPRLMFRYGEARTLTLSGVVMATPGNKRSLSPLLDEGVKMTRIDTKTMKPPVVSFVWGQRRFSPAFVTNFTFKETMWTTEGFASRAEGEFSLIEMPPTPTVTAPTKTVNTKVKASLTPRLLESGNAGAKSFLASDTRNLDETVRQVIQRNQFNLKTDDNGVVSLLKSNGDLIKVIGENVRGTFKPYGK